MKFNINLDKDNLKVYGKTAGRIGKAIVVEGVKALALKGAAAVITTSFEDGFSGVKNIELDDVIGKPKEKKPKKKLFGKKREKETVVEELLEEVTDETVEDKLAKAKKLLEENQD